MNSAASVPSTAPNAPNPGINNALITTFTTAPSQTEFKKTLSLYNGIKYCVLITLAIDKNIILGDKAMINILMPVKDSPKNNGAKSVAIAEIPHANPHDIAVANSKETLKYRLADSSLLFANKYDILGSITVPNAVIIPVGMLIIFSAFS